MGNWIGMGVEFSGSSAEDKARRLSEKKQEKEVGLGAYYNESIPVIDTVLRDKELARRAKIFDQAEAVQEKQFVQDEDIDTWWGKGLNLGVSGMSGLATLGDFVAGSLDDARDVGNRSSLSPEEEKIIANKEARKAIAERYNRLSNEESLREGDQAFIDDPFYEKVQEIYNKENMNGMLFEGEGNDLLSQMANTAERSKQYWSGRVNRSDEKEFRAGAADDVENIAQGVRDFKNLDVLDGLWNIGSGLLGGTAELFQNPIGAANLAAESLPFMLAARTPLGMAATFAGQSADIAQRGVATIQDRDGTINDQQVGQAVLSGVAAGAIDTAAARWLMTGMKLPGGNGLVSRALGIGLAPSVEGLQEGAQQALEQIAGADVLRDINKPTGIDLSQLDENKIADDALAGVAGGMYGPLMSTAFARNNLDRKAQEALANNIGLAIDNTSEDYTKLNVSREDVDRILAASANRASSPAPTQKVQPEEQEEQVNVAKVLGSEEVPISDSEEVPISDSEKAPMTDDEIRGFVIGQYGLEGSPVSNLSREAVIEGTEKYINMLHDGSIEHGGLALQNVLATTDFAINNKININKALLLNSALPYSENSEEFADTINSFIHELRNLGVDGEDNNDDIGRYFGYVPEYLYKSITNNKKVSYNGLLTFIEETDSVNSSTDNSAVLATDPNIDNSVVLEPEISTDLSSEIQELQEEEVDVGNIYDSAETEIQPSEVTDNANGLEDIKNGDASSKDVADILRESSERYFSNLSKVFNDEDDGRAGLMRYIVNQEHDDFNKYINSLINGSSPEGRESNISKNDLQTLTSIAKFLRDNGDVENSAKLEDLISKERASLSKISQPAAKATKELGLGEEWAAALAEEEEGSIATEAALKKINQPVAKKDEDVAVDDRWKATLEGMGETSVDETPDPTEQVVNTEDQAGSADANKSEDLPATAKAVAELNVTDNNKPTVQTDDTASITTDAVIPAIQDTSSNPSVIPAPIQVSGQTASQPPSSQANKTASSQANKTATIEPITVEDVDKDNSTVNNANVGSKTSNTVKSPSYSVKVNKIIDSYINNNEAVKAELSKRFTTEEINNVKAKIVKEVDEIFSTTEEKVVLGNKVVSGFLNGFIDKNVEKKGLELANNLENLTIQDVPDSKALRSKLLSFGLDEDLTDTAIKSLSGSKKGLFSSNRVISDEDISNIKKYVEFSYSNKAKAKIESALPASKVLAKQIAETKDFDDKVALVMQYASDIYKYNQSKILEKDKIKDNPLSTVRFTNSFRGYAKRNPKLIEDPFNLTMSFLGSKEGRKTLETIQGQSLELTSMEKLKEIPLIKTLSIFSNSLSNPKRFIESIAKKGQSFGDTIVESAKGVKAYPADANYGKYSDEDFDKVDYSQLSNLSNLSSYTKEMTRRGKLTTANLDKLSKGIQGAVPTKDRIDSFTNTDVENVKFISDNIDPLFDRYKKSGKVIDAYPLLIMKTIQKVAKSKKQDVDFSKFNTRWQESFGKLTVQKVLEMRGNEEIPPDETHKINSLFKVALGNEAIDALNSDDFSGNVKFNTLDNSIKELVKTGKC